MAALGDIVVTYVDNRVSQENTTPWVGDNTSWKTTDRSGTLSGVVKLSGTIEPNSVVHLYYRVTGERIATFRSNAIGEYSFSGLDKNSSKYYLVFITEEDFNTLTFDKLTPE